MNQVHDPPEFTVTTSDFHRFYIPYAVRAMSSVINAELESYPGGNILLNQYDRWTLQPVVNFLRGHARGNEREKRIFNDRFLRGLPVPTMWELFRALQTARDLGIPVMVDVVSRRIADRIKDKSVAWVQERFGIQNNLPEEMEMEVRDQFPWAFENIGVD